MSGMMNRFKKRLYNFTQKTKKKSNEIIGTEMEVEPQVEIEGNEESEVELESELEDVLPEIEHEEEKVKLTDYEKEILPFYVGCFSDDPSNLSMKKYLGIVSNPVECIKLGKQKGYGYVGVQQGDKCYASNSVPETTSVDEKHCNIRCNDPKTGTCGGYFYNKVYKTNLANPDDNSRLQKNDTFNIVEHYNNMNAEVNNISRNVEDLNYENSEFNVYPINMYILSVILIIIIIIFYLIIEKLN